MKRKKIATMPVRLEAHAHRIAKVKSASEGISIQRWISNLIEDFINGNLIRIKSNKSNISYVENEALKHIERT